MKKVIEQILQDDNFFNRKRPLLSFSISEIEGEVEYGKTLQGSFKIIADTNAEAGNTVSSNGVIYVASDKYKPEGFIYSTDLRMSVNHEQFGGKIMEITYQYDAKGLEEGSIMEGKLDIVSNVGEYEIPYRIRISKNVPKSSMGEVRNLFHFTNLAKSNWLEAVNLFYSSHFPEILSQNQENYEEYLTVYRSLIQVSNQEFENPIDTIFKKSESQTEYLDQDLYRDQNLENFLVYTRKKTRITYMADVIKIAMEAPSEMVKQKICIVREGWGYTRIKVEVQGEFLSIDKNIVLDEDFLGNVYELNYYIDPDKVYLQENKGKIIVSDKYNRIEIPVTIARKGKALKYAEESISNVHRDRKALVQIMNGYLDFRLGRLSKNQWTRENAVIINRMLHRDMNDVITRLYQVQLLITEGNLKEAELILQRVGIFVETEELSPEIKGYYYYLSSLCNKSDSEIRELVEKTELLYVQNVKSWRLAWMMLYLKPEYLDNDQKKWDFIKHQYEIGNNSPILFLEAIQAVTRTPSIMSELSDFELTFLSFVNRKHVFSKEIRNRFVFLVPRIKAFSDEIFDLLKACYSLEEKDETLQEICVLLMKGNKIGNEYFCWYERAVEHEIRVTRLYEYYLMSIDLEYSGKLPKMILMYFAYRSNLDYERNAFLYANILKHKKEYRDIYDEYYPIIEQFACEQLLKGRISDNLGFIYEQMIPPLLEEPEYATAYLKLYFKAVIHTEKEGMVNVVVSNKALSEEYVYPIYQGDANIDLVGNQNVIALEDEYGDRYFDEEFYSKEFVIKNRNYLEKVLKNADISLMSALYQAGRYGNAIVIEKDNVDDLLWLSQQPQLTKQYQIELMLNLLQYYFDLDEISALDELIERFNPDELNCNQREICIHIMVARGMYDKAMEWIRNYGKEGIDYKIILRLCDRVLMRSDFAFDSEILRICEDTFNTGKYDETMLKYLIKYAKGNSMQLKNLWRAADSFDLDVHELLEKMLLQILYSGEVIGEETNIYQEYVAGGAHPELEKAFLVFLSYKYFNKQEKVDEKVFDRVIYLTQYDEKVPLCCKLAYLKKTTEVMKRGRLFDAEKALIPVYLKEMAANQIFFPFFMEFKKLAPELEMMADRCFIEYHGNEGSRVILHYVIEQEGTMNREYKKEEMPHMYAGIYIKSFILFQSEKIQYYITEEDGRSEKLTQSSVLERNSQSAPGEINKESRFAMINSLVVSRENKDYANYCKIAGEYAKQSYLVEHLFKPE